MLAAHGFASLPPQLQDVVAFVDHGDLLAEYLPDDRRRLLDELREAAG
ncbi:MAG: hypothetical protein R6T93_14650 [Trueperaceae bacterium]